MTIKYVGTRDNDRVGGYCKGKRYAEFSYRDEEEARFEKIAAYLEMNGYEIDTGVANWATVEVGDREEYDMVAACFKAAKRLIKA